jgi:hypothetical protein
MGGLICRCLIQKIIPDQRPGQSATDYVDRFFTYATPHGGIAFDVGFGLLERLRDAFGVQGADIFGPRRMYQYLTPAAELDSGGPPDNWEPERMPDHSFPKDRIFCLIGTNPENYDVAMGLSAAAARGQERRAGPDRQGLCPRLAARLRAPQPQRTLRRGQLRRGLPEPAAFPLR